MARAMPRPEQAAGEAERGEPHGSASPEVYPPADQLAGAEEQHFVCGGGGEEGAARPLHLLPDF